MSTVVITGATGSMGREAVREMASRGHKVIMACRNLKKGVAVMEEIGADNIELRRLDLSSIASVQEFVHGLQADGVHPDMLFNNAGSMFRHYGVSADGFENTLAVNYVGPYLLTRLMLELMPPDGSIVNMVSVTGLMVNLDKALFDRGEKEFSQLRTYALSKLSLMLFTARLNALVPQKVNMADPGVVDTGIIAMDRWYDPLADMLFRPFCKSPAKGVAPALAALECGLTGQISKGRKIKDINKKFIEHPLSIWLWDKTEELLCEHGVQF